MIKGGGKGRRKKRGQDEAEIIETIAARTIREARTGRTSGTARGQ